MPRSGSRHAALAPFAAALAVALSGACTGSIEFGPPDDEPDNCLAYPSCDSGDLEVSECPADTTCYEASICGSTILCAEGLDQCEAYPTCEPGDEEVEVCPDDATCYEAEACGTVITCQSLVQCGAVPICDPGDTDVTAQGCPLDASCYEATMCGTTILCMDEGQTHGCPEEEPTMGDLCESEQVGIYCDYPEPDGCFKSFTCTDENSEAPYWAFIGEACP